MSLDKKLSGLYPLVDNGDSDILSLFESGELRFVSFRVKGSVIWTRSRILTKALEKAASQEDGVTYSEHGSEHGVFQESLRRLDSYIKKGSVNEYFQTNIRKFKGVTKTYEYPIERYIIESPHFQRTTARPNPQLYAKKLRGDEKDITKALRDISIQRGIPYAILAALYKGKNDKEIINIFSDKQYRERLMYKFGKNVRFVHPTHQEDVVMLRQLSSRLRVVTKTGVYPSYSADDYNTALQILVINGWLTEEDLKKNRFYKFEQTTENPYIRGVFYGMTQFAQKYADENYLDPARSEYIFGKYENIASSRLLTAFMVFD